MIPWSTCQTETLHLIFQEYLLAEDYNSMAHQRDYLGKSIKRAFIFPLLHDLIKCILFLRILENIYKIRAGSIFKVTYCFLNKVLTVCSNFQWSKVICLFLVHADILVHTTLFKRDNL